MAIRVASGSEGYLKVFLGSIVPHCCTPFTVKITGKVYLLSLLTIPLF